MPARQITAVPNRPQMPWPIAAGNAVPQPRFALTIGEPPGGREIAPQHVAHPAEIAGHQAAHRGAARVRIGTEPQPHRPVVTSQRLVDAPQQKKGLAAPVMGRSIARTEPQRSIECRRGRPQTALLSARRRRPQ